MTEIDKTTQFNQRLTVTADDGGTVIYANLNATVDEQGIPYMSYNISNGDVYKAHVAEFKDAWEKFQATVFAEIEGDKGGGE